MKSDLPLLNQRPSETRSLGAQWMEFEGRKLVENQLAFERLRRVRELRKSMGVESPATNRVNVRLPPRYGVK